MENIIKLFNDPNNYLLVGAMIDDTNINQHDTDGLYFLHHLVSTNNTTIAKVLLEKGANPNVVTRAGETPLLQASRKGTLSMVKLLISYGANPDIYDENNDSPLLWAAYYGHLDTTIFLVENNADVYHVYKDGRDVLRWAVCGDQVEIVKYLLEYLRDIWHKDVYGFTIFNMDTNDEIRKIINQHVKNNKLILVNYAIKNKSPLMDFQLLHIINKFYCG
jgi:ankyrin repeat protein